MSNSPLVTYTKISPNRTSPRDHKIDTISIHCMAGQLSVESCGNVFASSNRQASSNYGIGPDGKIGMYVEERDRSWCTSNRANDMRAITIEVASDKTPPYAVTPEAYRGLINLLVDICKRNGIKQLLWQANPQLIGQVDKQNMTVHRWFAKKACPGDYLFSLHGQIAADVNARLGTKPVHSGVVLAKPEPKPPVSTEPEKQAKILASALNIRTGPSKSYAQVGVVKKDMICSIIDISPNNWGRLKDGRGWISLNPKYVKML